MKSYSLLVGSQHAGGRFRRSDEVILQQVTARHFPAGFTILDATGAWYDPSDARRRKEEARQVIVCTAQPRRLTPWCREVGEALRQKEVLVIESGIVHRVAVPAESSSRRRPRGSK